MVFLYFILCWVFEYMTKALDTKVFVVVNFLMLILLSKD